MNYEKKFFQMELAVKVLTGELELAQTEYRRHDQPNEEWKTCVLGPKEWNFDLVEYRIKPDKVVDWNRRPIEDGLRAKLTIALKALEVISNGWTEVPRQIASEAIAKLKE